MLKGDEPSAHVEEVDQVTESLDSVALKEDEDSEDEDNTIEEV